jgi:hypothetical protein
VQLSSSCMNSWPAPWAVVLHTSKALARLLCHGMDMYCTVQYTLSVLRMFPIARLVVAVPAWVAFKDCFEQVPCIFTLPKANLDVLSRWPLPPSPRIPCVLRDWSNLRPSGANHLVAVRFDVEPRSGPRRPEIEAVLLATIGSTSCLKTLLY